jgi:hypothetical protein
MRIWIKTPLAGLDAGAAGGLVVDGTMIAERLPPAASPRPRWTKCSTPASTSSCPA